MSSIYFIGFRASGKTSLGESVSKILEIPFYDLDHIFEERFGNISEYVTKNGWEHFREKETRLLQEYKNTPAIIATGGGIIESQENRNFLQKSASIFIHAPIEILTNRLSSTENNRPRLIPNISPEEEIIQTYTKRLPLYESVSELQFVPTGKLENDARNLAKQIQTSVL